MAKPDGYTLLVALVSISSAPEVDKLFGRPTTYTRDQFVGIARLNADPPILAVNGPWKTLKELVDDAKKRHGEITFASSGPYGASHLPLEMFLQAAGLKMRHLPTTGGGPGYASTNIAFLVFRTGILSNDIGAGSAGGVVAVIIANIVAIFLMRAVGKNLDA